MQYVHSNKIWQFYQINLRSESAKVKATSSPLFPFLPHIFFTIMFVVAIQYRRPLKYKWLVSWVKFRWENSKTCKLRSVFTRKSGFSESQGILSCHKGSIHHRFTKMFFYYVINNCCKLELLEWFLRWIFHSVLIANGNSKCICCLNDKNMFRRNIVRNMKSHNFHLTKIFHYFYFIFHSVLEYEKRKPSQCSNI